MARAAAVTTYHLSAPPGRVFPKMRIAAVADVHAVWPYMPLSRVQSIVDQTQALDCDLIVLLGDYVGHLPGGRALAVQDVANTLASLRAPLGVFAIFGNHDWRDDPDAKVPPNQHSTHWHAAFAQAGLHILPNAAARLDQQGMPFYLAGVDSQAAFDRRWPRRHGGVDDFASVANQIDPDIFTVLLAHEPDIFPDLPDWVDVTLSGHTHGGQIAPFGRPLYVPSKHGTRFAYGHHSHGPKQLIVSGGLGCSGVPFRIGRPPEIVVVEVS